MQYYLVNIIDVRIVSSDEFGLTPLECALDLGIYLALDVGNTSALRVLLVRGAKLSSEEHGRYLIKAAKAGNEEVFQILRAHDVKAEMKEEERDGAIQEALEHNNHKAYKLLLEFNKPPRINNAIPLERKCKEKPDIPLITKKTMTLTLDTTANTRADYLSKPQTRNILHIPLHLPTKEVN